MGHLSFYCMLLPISSWEELMVTFFWPTREHWPPRVVYTNFLVFLEAQSRADKYKSNWKIQFYAWKNHSLQVQWTWCFSFWKSYTAGPDKILSLSSLMMMLKLLKKKSTPCKLTRTDNEAANTARQLGLLRLLVPRPNSDVAFHGHWLQIKSLLQNYEVYNVSREAILQSNFPSSVAAAPFALVKEKRGVDSWR